MNKNVGLPDRTVRVTVGLGLLIAALLVERGGLWLAIPGAALVLTGLVGSCWLYSATGINTHSGQPKL